MAESQKASPELIALYRRAFAEYGAQALWNLCALDSPDAEDALVVARALRLEGDMRARTLAEKMERACLATV